MDKQAITSTLKSPQKTMRKHSLAILAGIGITRMTAAVVMAVRTAPEALHMVDGKEIGDEKRLTISGIVKTTRRCYIPAAATGVCSIACIIGASSVSTRRNAALVTTYTISETVLKGYKGRAVEIVGPKKEQTIWDAMAREQPERVGVPEREFIPTGWSGTSCFDPLTGTCFKSDYETLRGVENALSKRLRDEVKITVNDFLEGLGFPSCDPAIGDSLGWDVDKGRVGFDFSSQLVDGIPCLVIRHRDPPRYTSWRHPQKLHLLLWRAIYGTLCDKKGFTTEEMNAEVMENEELENITEAEETGESDSAGALITGVVGGFLTYAMIGEVRRLWGFVDAKLAEREAAKKAKTKVVDAEYAEVAAEGSDEEDFEK